MVRECKLDAGCLSDDFAILTKENCWEYLISYSFFSFNRVNVNDRTKMRIAYCRTAIIELCNTS